ncbi:putative ribonuclease H-like domain-containing protein, partial [Tanacetum coccineum]
MNRELVRRNVTVETTETKALVAQDGLGSDSEVSTYSKASLKSYETLKEHYDNLTKDFNKSQLNVSAYKEGLESVEARLDVYKKNEIQVSDKFKTGVGFDSQVVNSHVCDSQENDRYKTSKGYHVVPPPYTGNFMPLKYDLVLADKGEYVFSESVTSIPDVVTSEAKTSVLKPNSVGEPLIKDWISDSGDENETEFKSKQKEPSFDKYKIGNPQLELQEKGVINSGCSRHITGNKSYLSDYEEIDGGFVAFGGDPKGGRITSKGKISTGGLTYLFAKATLDESNLWHRRLGHINFKTLNKLDFLDVGFKQLEEEEKMDSEHPEDEDIYGCFDDPKMHNLEEIVYSDNDEEVGAETDMNNLATTVPVSPIPTTRVHKDHPLKQIIRDIQSAPQTKRMTKSVTEHASTVLEMQKVWTLADLPYGKRAIGTKWVYRNKKNDRGIVVRNKARLVAQGYTQEEGIDYDEVFTPVARIEVIMLFLAYASFMNFIVYQIDVKSSFLYGIIKEEVYVCQPPGFEDTEFLNKVYKVEKVLYGLHHAPKACYKTLSTYLLENGFRRGTIDITLFIKKDKGDILLVQVYVDDIIFGSTKKSLCTEFEQMMHKRFQMSSMGELTFFLGLQVKQKDDVIFISQDKCVADILKKFDFATVKTASTPMETNKALLKDEEATDVDVPSNTKDFTSSCREENLRYLKGHPKLGLWYPRDSPFDLEAFSDSDYAGASLDRKSTTGAEYVAATNCCGQVLWIQNQLLDYGYNFMNTKIFIDNESTICIVKNPVFHSKTKHIEIRHHFIRDSYEKRLIQVIKIHTDYNVADLLTKAFDTQKPRKAKRTTEISQSSGPIPFVLDETVIKEWEDKIERAATSASSLEVEQDSGIINRTQSMETFNESFPQGIDSELVRVKIHDGNAFWNEIGVNAGVSKLMLLSLNLLLPVLVYSARHLLITVRHKLMLPDITYYCWVQTINGERQIQALVDKKKVIITETSIRGDLKLEDAKGTDCLPTATIFAELERMGRKQRNENGPTESILDEATNEEPISTLSYDPPQSGKDRLQLTELMNLCTKLQQQVLDLEEAKTAQAKEIASLKKRVKQLEKIRKSRPLGLKRLRNFGSASRVESSNDVSLGSQEDASKHGRKIADLDVDKEVTLIDETQKRNDEEMLFDVQDDLQGEEVVAEKEVIEKDVGAADPVTTAGEVV